MTNQTVDQSKIDQIETIHLIGIEQAKQVEADYIAMYGEPMYCGFAWVSVYKVRSNSKLGKALQAVGFRKSYDRSLMLWNPGGSPTQSMDVKEVGARAYANVLTAHGVKAYMSSRAD